MPHRILTAVAVLAVGAGVARGQDDSPQWVGAYGSTVGPGGQDFGGVNGAVLRTTPDGGVVVAGTVWADATNFKLTGPVDPIDTSGRFLFVAKYDAAGVLAWVKSFQGNQYSSMNALAVAPNGDIVAGGIYGGSEVVETVSGPVVLNSPTQLQGFLVRLTGAGAALSASIVGPYVYGARFDGGANLHYWGAGYGAVDLDPGPGEDPVEMGNSLGSTYVVKLSPAGTYRYGLCMGTDAPAIIFGMAVDPRGNLYLSGLLYRASFDFGLGRGRGVLESTYDSGFVMKRSPAGRLDWARLIEARANAAGGGGRVEARHIAYDERGDTVVVGGQFMGAADFEPGAGRKVHRTPDPNLFNVFVTAWDADGGREGWTRTLDANYLLGLDVDPGGRVAVVGLPYNRSVDVNPGGGRTVVQGDAFLGVLRRSGSFLWGGALVADGGIYTAAIAFDGQGDLCYGATTTGAADFDPTAGVAALSYPRLYSGLGKLRPGR